MHNLFFRLCKITSSGWLILWKYHGISFHVNVNQHNKSNLHDRAPSSKSSSLLVHPFPLHISYMNHILFIHSVEKSRSNISFEGAHKEKMIINFSFVWQTRHIPLRSIPNFNNLSWVLRFSWRNNHSAKTSLTSTTLRQTRFFYLNIFYIPFKIPQTIKIWEQSILQIIYSRRNTFNL